MFLPRWQANHMYIVSEKILQTTLKDTQDNSETLTGSINPVKNTWDKGGYTICPIFNSFIFSFSSVFFVLSELRTQLSHILLF